MMLSEQLRQFPECPHRTGNYCTWISERIGRLYSVTPILCNFTCRTSGPHKGQNPPHEETFLASMWNRNSPAGDKNLARRVLSNYARPVNVHVPAIWQRIKDSLEFLNNITGFDGIMLTGSVILRQDETPKDLDIVLRCQTVASAVVIRETLPKYIAGIKTDFYFYIGDKPDVYFACLDCEARKLYVSRWLPLTIASIEPGIEVVERGTNTYGKALRALLVDPVPMPEAQAGWRGVFREWQQLTSFVAAARSRGIMATAKHVAGFDNTDGFHCDNETLQKRRDSCFGNGQKPPCALLVTNSRGHRFCGACGCGETQIARLDADTPEQFSKLDYKVLRCPIKADGFTH